MLAFRSSEELQAAFPLPQDLNIFADFAFCAAELPDMALLDAPPTMVNHASESKGANTAFRFIDGKVKEVIATRDIEAGEELLQDYRQIAQVQWLEQLLSQAQLQSARQLGVEIGD